MLAALPLACGFAAPALRPRSVAPAVSRSAPLPFMVATLPSPEAPSAADYEAETVEDIIARIPLSGLQGKAMRVEKSDIPTKAQVRQAIPAHCFKRNTAKSMMYAAISVAQSAACLWAGTLIPMKAAFAPLWLAYAAVTGTVWTGMWVVAHECGHKAFSDNLKLQDAVGYFLHTLLLVPYFSWQRSHAVHHAHTNHITKGETHVPFVVHGREGIENGGGEHDLEKAEKLGKRAWGTLQLVFHLVFGWPAYLLWGATGGPKCGSSLPARAIAAERAPLDPNARPAALPRLGRYGTSNHFVPVKPFNTNLWPASWPLKVWRSDLGIGAMLGVLSLVASKIGGARLAMLYGAPYLFTNAWLVLYTWLQHTDVDVPHLTNDEFSYMRGAFLTVDRPYGRVFDWLHHKIGSTHVAHHIDCTIPHYHAREATDAIAKAFPKAYLYDPTPIHTALWRVASNCIAVKLQPFGGRYTWVPVGSQ